MDDSRSPQPDTGPAGAAALDVDVERSGGFAGLTRRWHAAPDAEDAGRWEQLIRRCPWDAPQPAPSGADTFMWRIRVLAPTGRERTATVPETQLSEPWRALIDAVRAWEIPDRD